MSFEIACLPEARTVNNKQTEATSEDDVCLLFFSSVAKT